jgi:hypothetical protein
VVERFTVAIMVRPQPQVPTADQFALDMEVPGYWDDHLSYIPEAPWGTDVLYSDTNSTPIRFPYMQSGRPRHPDAGVPFVTGVGWYKRTIEVPGEWRGRTVTLHVGGARIATYCYLNGIYLDKHHGHDTPFEIDLTDDLNYGESNELILGVDNSVNYLNSCALRGYAGHSGGIYGDVSLHVSPGAGRLESYYVHPEDGLSRLRWKAELRAPIGLEDETRLAWSVKGAGGGVIRGGEIPVRPMGAGETLAVDWACPSDGIAPWSIWEPNLHEIEVRWERGDGAAIDGGSRPFGLRRLESRDGRFYLNGRPVMLRGATEHHHFAPDIHPPNDVEYFRKMLLRLKEVGFNYLRFHTWVPSKPYMQAADEVGMLMGPEHSMTPTRNLEDDARWEAMVRWCRYHPSVVTYCGGNEELGHEGLIAKFGERQRIARALAPDAILIPMHTISGPESVNDRADLPLPPHFADEELYYAKLWDRVTRFSDAFAARANDFSYSNFTAPDWRELVEKYDHYTLPILAHESGIIETYINLDLESRYTGTMPADLYRAAREYITAAGRIDMAPVYYENSARWHGQARKYVLENLRKLDAFDGYDLLGGWDIHWHNSGYGCGLLNEFYEFKPGDTLGRVLQYNGESVLLLDNAKRHVFKGGEAFDMPLMASLYGGRDLAGGAAAWRVLDGESVLLSGELTGLGAREGAVSELGRIQFNWPVLDVSGHLVLEVGLRGEGYDLSNSWDFWVFPERAAPAVIAAADGEALALLAGRYTGIRSVGEVPDARLRVVRMLTESDVEHLAGGGDVLLLGAKPFPANETRFQIGLAGRAHMNLATVIKEHPVMKHLPHAGWCDWQFQDLLENGQCAEFNKFPVEFDPIVEVVSSYKYIRLQASMWEARVDAGRIFTVSFNLNMEDPATLALLDGVFEYVQGDGFEPRVSMPVEEVIRPLLQGVQFKSLKGNDGNFYSGMSLF